MAKKQTSYVLSTKIAPPSNLCVNCGKPISEDRLEALQTLGTPPERYTHVQCSTVTKVKGIYLGEVGTSQLQLCDKIYNDSVRSVFRKTALDDDDDEEKDEVDNTV